MHPLVVEIAVDCNATLALAQATAVRRTVLAGLAGPAEEGQTERESKARKLSEREANPEGDLE